MATTKRQPKTIRHPSIVIRRTGMDLVFPYHSEFKDEMKREVSFQQRQWNPETKIWTFTMSKEILLILIRLSKKYFKAQPQLYTDGISIEEILEGKTIDRSSYYALLEIDNKATDKEIKKAYYQLVKLHHPDVGGDKERFNLVSRAYQCLSDPRRRKRYDAALSVIYHGN